MGIERRAALCWFAAGIIVGAAWPLERAAMPAVGAAIARMSGNDDPAAPLGDLMRPTLPNVSLATTPALSPAVSAQASPLVPRSAAEIASLALASAVFIRGGHAYGAGVLLDDHGHVLTCAHVIEGLPAISVAFSDGATLPASVLERDDELDVALLQIESRRAPHLNVASITDVAPGDDLFAIGAPRKMGFSFNRGMASFVGRPFKHVYYLQTDLPMNPGSSGGPVLDQRGRLVALASFVLRESEGLAFALPIDYALRRFARVLQVTGERAPETAGEGGFEDWLSARAQSEAASD